MKQLREFATKLRLSEQFVANKTAQFFSENTTADIIEQYNKKQLAEGGDSEGRGLGDYSMQRTVERREAGKQTDFIDLNFTGDFYESIEARGQLTGNKASLVIDSVGDKWDEIKDDVRFEDALGLTQENADKVGIMLSEYLAKELDKYWNYGS